MPTYDFYKNCYLGSCICEAAFPEMIARAQAWIEKLERTCSVTASGPDSRAMAVCAVAETMAAWYKKRDIAQTTIGGVTIRYEKSDIALQRQLLQSAQTFLEVCRGVG